MADKKEYLYGIEVVKESRTIIKVPANNQAEAYAAAEKLVQEDAIEWQQKDQVSTTITARTPNE
jgi:hypothetical protein